MPRPRPRARPRGYHQAHTGEHFPLLICLKHPHFKVVLIYFVTLSALWTPPSALQRGWTVLLVKKMVCRSKYKYCSYGAYIINTPAAWAEGALLVGMIISCTYTHKVHINSTKIEFSYILFPIVLWLSVQLKISLYLCQSYVFGQIIEWSSFVCEVKDHSKGLWHTTDIVTVAVCRVPAQHTCLSTNHFFVILKY